MSGGRVSVLYSGRARVDAKAAMVRESTPGPDEQAAVLHAKYARVVAVRLGIRFADDPAALKEITEALGLVS